MILLDTQALLWLRGGSPHLGARARREIDRAWSEGGVAVSAITFWEVALLGRRGRMVFPGDVSMWRLEQLQQGLVEIAVTGEIAVRSFLLPDLHADPADRIVLATALGGHRLVTSDRRLLGWPGDLSRLDARE